MRVIVYAPPDVHAGELSTVCDVLAFANRSAITPPHYDTQVVSYDAGPLRSVSGLRLLPDALLAEIDEDADLLIVAASASWQTDAPVAVTDWLRRQAAGAIRYGAIGNGVFLLGAAGLLDGYSVTTHWECAAELALRFPAARIEPDRIFVRDRALFSGAGGVAATDLMLALVEEDHGRELALSLARRFILFMKRSGGQAQVSLQLEAQATTRDPIQRAQKQVRDNPAGDLSVAALAAVAAMSPRNFSRVFLQETGLRPSDFVEIFRVNLARRMLEENALPPQQIARLCGFPSAEAARRAFKRRAGMTMSRFRAGLATAAGG